MKSLLVLLMTFCLIFTVGCKKTVYTENTEASEEMGPVFAPIDGTGLVKKDTPLFTSSGFNEGLSLIAGEKVTLLGEGDEHYMCFYQDVKGYVVKNAIEIVEDNGSSKPTNTKEEWQKEVIIREQIKEEIYEERHSNSVPSESTAAPPPTLYTTKYGNVYEISSLLGDSINKARTSRGLKSLNMNSALSKQASYYCDIFASRKSIFQIDGIGVQAAGKMPGSDRIIALGEPLVENISGFDGKNLSRMGIAVVKSDDGTFYYCVLAQ